MLLNINWYQIFYWFTIGDNVKTILGPTAVIFGILSLVSVIGFFISLSYKSENIVKGTEEEQTTLYREWNVWNRGWKKSLNIAVIIFFMSSLFWVFIPSKKEALLIIAGGSVGNFLTTDSSAKALPSDLTRYLHIMMKNEIDNMGSDTKKELGLQTEKERYLEKIGNLTKEQIIEQLKSDTTLLK